MIEWLWWVLPLLGGGLLAGLMAGLFGIGGGLIIVPILFQIYQLQGLSVDIAMPTAVATSLGTIVFTSMQSARSHHSRGTLDFALLKRWAPWAFLGAALGVVTSTLMAGAALKSFFALFVWAVAAQMILSTLKKTPADATPKGQMPGYGRQALYGTLVGQLSTLLGIGGGTLMVPLLSWHGFTIHRAVGTAAGFGAVISLPAVIGYAIAGLAIDGRPPLSLGYVHGLAFLLILPCTLLMAPVGAALAYRLNGLWLKRLFAIFLIIVGLRMMLS